MLRTKTCCVVIAAAVAAVAFAAPPASAGYGLYASCTITANDPVYAFVQQGGTAGYGVYGSTSLKCLQGETVAMQGRLQKYVSGTWTTVATGSRTPPSGYQTLGGGGTAGTINSGVSLLPCSSGTYRTWNLANINGTQHSAYSANSSINC